MTAEKSSSNMFRCCHCTKEFKYESERKRHEISHIPRFECDICSKKFSFISALRRHKKQHERTGSVKCEECGGKFRDETLLKRHINYAHKGTYVCAKCDASFSSELALRTHTKTHKPLSDRKYRCKFEFCGKSFNFSHHLKHHELTHTNEKQHYCNVCGKGFIQYHHLKTHLKTHDPEKLLYCKFSNCRKKFATEYARKRHHDTHKKRQDSGISSDTNSNNDDFVSGTAICTNCGESISQKQYEIHKSICVATKEEINNVVEVLFETSLLRIRNGTNEEPTTKSNIDSDIINCKTTLGTCIMNEDSDSSCLCAQISKPIDEQYDFTPIDKIDDSLPVKSETKMLDVNRNNNICEDCECASSKSFEKQIAKDGCPKRITVRKNMIEKMPDMEYRTDGIVKIKETFDKDIVDITKVKVEKNNNEVRVPFNSCKDVLGNCIVSGDGTMGEGCLCARMIIDEQQMMAQEIDDITPHPKIRP